MSGPRPGLALAARAVGLAAAPTFAVMALLAGRAGEEPMAAVCMTGHMTGHGAPFGGMASMYLLMAAFHTPPWLGLVAGGRRQRRSEVPAAA